jgi:hypothetical protein
LHANRGGFASALGIGRHASEQSRAGCVRPGTSDFQKGLGCRTMQDDVTPMSHIVDRQTRVGLGHSWAQPFNPRRRNEGAS